MVAAIIAATITPTPTLAADPVLLHAAGSLRAALTDVAKAFEVRDGRSGQR